MKNKLYIASRWNENNLKDAWAGTSYSLLVALEEKFQVTRIAVEPKGFIFKLIERISYKFKKLISFKFYIVEKYLNSKINKDTPVLMYPCLYKCKSPYYVYRDNTYEAYTLFKARKEIDPWPYNNLHKLFNDKVDLPTISQIEKEAYEKASGIFFMGEWLAEYMKNQYPQWAHKIYAAGGGMNFTPIPAAQNKSGKKILFVGKDFTRKGGDVVLEAFKILRQRDPKVELHIAGPKNMPFNEDTDGVIFHGLLGFEEVRDLMAACDIFCMPSYFEAYGLVFVEALCMGLPCIGRNCWEMPYFIERGITGELLENDSPEELAYLIEKILSDDKYKNNVAERHHYYLNKYNWRNVAEFIETKIKQKS